MKVSRTTCSIIDDSRLSGFLDGKLDGNSMRAIDSHLIECETCRTELSKLAQTRALFKELPTPSMPESATFWADAYRTARLEGQSQRSGNLNRSSLIGRAGVIVGTAGVAALLGLALLANGPTTPGGGSFSPPASIDQVDVTSLVSAHANYVSGRQLADGANNRIIRSDLAAQKSGDPNAVPTDLVSPEPLVHAISD